MWAAIAGMCVVRSRTSKGKLSRTRKKDGAGFIADIDSGEVKR